MPDTRDELAADREWLVNQIAHALRNPIFAATVQTEALHLRIDDREALVKTVDSLHAQLQRLSNSIDEMLLFGRPVRLTLEQVQVAEVLTALAADYRAGDRQAPARIALAEPDPRLIGRWDRNALVVILERMLDNAIQHTDPPHEVRLSAAVDGDGAVVFTVADNGHGIPPQILEKILMPFFPQHSGRPGLGLAIADKFARVLGGRIEIDSAEGSGTVARCILPMSADG